MIVFENDKSGPNEQHDLLRNQTASMLKLILVYLTIEMPGI